MDNNNEQKEIQPGAESAGVDPAAAGDAVQDPAAAEPAQDDQKKKLTACSGF